MQLCRFCAFYCAGSRVRFPHRAAAV